MVGFTEYVSKPIVRLAYEITVADRIESGVKPSTSEIIIDGNLIEFKHYEAIRPGDFIVYLTDDDIYHCKREVFLERNEV